MRALHPQSLPSGVPLRDRVGYQRRQITAGRRRRFQKRFYSTLAGFMEPGETCEEAVVREVREEVGIEVGNIRYYASQPWPFPSQVMLGFFARMEVRRT